MSFSPDEEYLGLTAGIYDALKDYPGFANLKNQFTPVADGKYYIFNGDFFEYEEFMFDAGFFDDPELEAMYGLGYFRYMNSTWIMGGY